jgi:hypothetical protein
MRTTALRKQRREQAQLGFEALSIEGGLISADWLARVAQLQATRQTDADYRIPKGLNVRDEIGRYWRMAQALWSDFAAGRAASGNSVAHSERFVAPLLRDVFGFATLGAAKPVEIDGRVYPIGYEAQSGRVPVVIAGVGEGPDAAAARFGDGGRRRSAFGLAQEYLNAADGALWGLATDGLSLRILRDNASLTRPAWIEADLARLFTEELYADFAALWLLIHETRFGKHNASAADSPLELWRAAGREEGTRARERLRRGVEEALELLGQGFLSHPANTRLRQALQDGTITTQAYFQQQLRLVYRLIFLLTVEERGLLHPTDSPEAAKRRYAEAYSLRRLRERASRRNAHDRFGDLWEALKITFRGAARGEPRLALPPLGGLFGEDQCPALDAASLENRGLLGAVFRLAWLREEGGLSHVNWRDMGPEELGSVYEGLLELVPQITMAARRFGFARGAETKGNARKLSGSYYTPDSLVQALLDSALEPVIEAKIAAHPEEPAAALLSISVIDPACGSGHFLLAAARRIAAHVARLQTGGTPSATDYRRALRQVISHCIFGIDRNPMALELARTALWLEAMTPDAPLAFIDHHLICGDALIGLMDLTVLKDGIPNEAFKPLAGDDKEVARRLAKTNRTALKSLERTRATGAQLGFEFLDRAAVQQLRQLDALPDDTLDAVAAKRATLQRTLAEAWDVKAHPLALAADLYLAAFLAPKQKETEAAIPTTADLAASLDGQPVREGVTDLARREVARPPVLHWSIAFAQVFDRGGFDAVLGNPPWERIKLQEQEFFASRDPEVAEARNKAERTKLISVLETSPSGSSQHRLFLEFEVAKREFEAASVFAHHSRRYPLTGKGDVNTYALFAETALQMLSENGRAGLILPFGIATDETTSSFFGHVSNGRLISLFSFEEIRRWFPATDDRKSFCLMTLGRGKRTEFALNLSDLAELQSPGKRFHITAKEIAILNPNTLTGPSQQLVQYQIDDLVPGFRFILGSATELGCKCL